MPGMSTRAPTSLLSASDHIGVSRHVAWVHCLTERPDDGQWPVWLTACYHLTPQLQRVGPGAALLDLGACTDTEAVEVVNMLITRLQSQQVTLRAAIASSGILAQLALLHAPAHEPLTLLITEQSAALLRELSITALIKLQFGDQTMITQAALAQAISKLGDYGVRSLAHLGRLDAAYLRRQFGVRVGTLLVAVAHGEDVLPFQPTPAPLQLHFRLRLKTSASAGCLLAGLAPFTLEVASALARRGLQGHTLEMLLRWESGTSERITRTLPQPIASSRSLNETVQRMLMPIFQDDTHAHTPLAIEDFHLIVSHLVPRYPAQHTFWQQRTRRLAAFQELAAVLSHRYGKPLLFKRLLTAPDAIFDQDRSRLAPLNADLAGGQEVQGHGGRPTADVAFDADTSADISHGIHWW